MARAGSEPGIPPDQAILSGSWVERSGEILPALPLVPGPEDDVAPVVDRLILEGIDGQGRGPMAPVPEAHGLVVQKVLPRAHRPGGAHVVVETGDLVPITGGPDDIRVLG